MWHPVVLVSEKTAGATQHGGRLQIWLFVALCWLVPDLKLNYANATNGDLARRFWFKQFKHCSG